MMQWAKLSNVQRAYMGAHRQQRDVLKSGKLIRRGEPKNGLGEMRRTAFALDRDAERARDTANKLAMQMALATITPEVIAATTRKIKTAAARGAYIRRKGNALPMQYFRKGGSL